MDEKNNPTPKQSGLPPESAGEEPPLLEVLFPQEQTPEELTPPAEDSSPAPEQWPEAEELPQSPAEEPFDAADDAPPEEVPADEALPEEVPAEEALPADLHTPEEPALPPEPLDNARPDGAEFMAHIPDVEEEPAPRFQDPQLGQELTADHGAMDQHALMEHGQTEPEFDLDILNDPIFAPTPEPPAQEEDVDDQEYRDNGQEPEPEPKAPESPFPEFQIPTKKGRPKRKKGEGLLGIPNILVTVVWLALIVAIGVTAGRMLWVCAAEILAFGREDSVVTVTIYEADTMDDITEKLYNAGLIRYRSLFNLYASISDAEEDIQPGIYDLNTRYDYHALVNSMTPRSSREVVTLTIPEGYTCRQIFALLEENRICTAVDVAAYAASGELEEYWFLENVERGNEYCLEGFLFPDTYEFYRNSTPKEALERMLDNFGVRFSDEMRAQIDNLNANITGGGYGVREVVIVASLIERESAAPSESARIAGVIYNRLFNWGDTPAYLNIDAALVYAQGGDNENIDTTIDSPYNTYTHVGLTPTPIANPGLSSLEAALNPEAHNYYYYVLNPSTGMHQFSTTYDEHETWRAQFSAAE